MIISFLRNSRDDGNTAREGVATGVRKSDELWATVLQFKANDLIDSIICTENLQKKGNDRGRNHVTDKATLRN